MGDLIQTRRIQVNIYPSRYNDRSLGVIQVIEVSIIHTQSGVISIQSEP